MLRRPPRVSVLMAMCAVMLGASGCFRHEYVVSGAVPEATPTLSEWQHNFLWGAVSGTRGVDLREVCPAGVARIENGVSPANVLVHILTVQIYAPTRIRVYCRYLPPAARTAAPAPHPGDVPRPEAMPADAGMTRDAGVAPAPEAP